MARVAVLIDRPPDDPDWKGGYAWDLIRGLAESQHEVIAFTTVDLDRLDVSHPRLELARPAPTFSVDRLPAWTRALLQWRPEVVHTFALRAHRAWPSLTVWPYLDGALRVFPHIKRVVTLFDSADIHAQPAWLHGAHHRTVFDPALAAFAASTSVIPIDTPRVPPGSSSTRLIATPASTWTDFAASLAAVAAMLGADREARLAINGGWGDLPLALRRRGWATLGDAAARTSLMPALSLATFRDELSRAAGVFEVEAHGWRARLAAHLGARPGGAMSSGESSVNHFSRLYLS